MSRISRTINIISKLHREKIVINKLYTREISISAKHLSFMDKKLSVLIDKIGETSESKALSKAEICFLKRKLDNLLKFYQDPKKTDYEKNVKTFMIFSDAANKGMAYEMLKMLKSEFPDESVESYFKFGIPRESINLILLNKESKDYYDSGYGDYSDSKKIFESLPFLGISSYMVLINSFLVACITNDDEKKLELEEVIFTDSTPNPAQEFFDEMLGVLMAGEPL